MADAATGGHQRVLLFSAPNAPFAQPANVIGGYVLSTVIGLAVASILPIEWWSLGLAVGLAIAAMHLCRVTHPPAGAAPIIVLLARPGWGFVIFPALAGSVALLLCALAVQHLPPRTTYPLPLPSREPRCDSPLSERTLCVGVKFAI
jgi:CBS-domain-containing membrane protein